jgi:Dr1-associated corepressor
VKRDFSTPPLRKQNMTEGGIQGQWKSRFPVARIKKIMQADEEVGKVAQVTPVAICLCPFCLCFFTNINVAKALELFLDRIIKSVADETRSRGAKRVLPSHL